MPNAKLLTGLFAALCFLLFSFTPRVNAAVLNRLLLRPHALSYDANEFEKLSASYNCERQTFNNIWGEPLNAWFIRNPARQGEIASVVFYLMGRDADCAARAKAVTQILESGSSVFIFDYSGFGLSKGNASVNQMFWDSDFALNFLTVDLGVDIDQTIFFGESMGCAIAVSLANRYCPAALVLKSAFTDLPRAMREQWPILKVVPSAIMRVKKLEVLKNLREVEIPLLIAHGLNDRLISCHNAIDLYHAAAARTADAASLLLLEQSRHAYMS